MTPPVGKSGPGNDLVEIVDGQIDRIVDQRDAGIDDFAEIVRRNVGCHADGDAAAPLTSRFGNFAGSTTTARVSLPS